MDPLHSHSLPDNLAPSVRKVLQDLPALQARRAQPDPLAQKEQLELPARKARSDLQEQSDPLGQPAQQAHQGRRDQ